MLGLNAALSEALPSHRVGEEIGRGAFGVVYAAEHVELGRMDAIKVLGPWVFSDSSIRNRFRNEARILSGLQHPHIVQLHDFVQTEDVCALVMERLDGGSLELPGDADSADVARACALGSVLAGAIHAAHKLEVLHRDIKPENLLFTRDGVMKVGDFGIAKLIGATSAGATLAGGFVGSPAYMAPEQLGGSRLGPATDIYGAGIVLYQMLCGELPFDVEGDLLEVAVRRTQQEPKPLQELAPAVPDVVSNVVMRALSANYDDRYSDAEEFGVALAHAATLALGTQWLERSGVPVLAAGPILDATREPVDTKPDPLATVVRDRLATVVKADPVPAVPDGAGKAFGPDYVLHERVGQGAMGQVFRATERQTGEVVALKVLRSELTDDEEVRARFVQEKAILTQIDDEHVVRVRDLVETPDGLGIVAEFVDGPDLHRYLLDRGTLTPAEAVDLTIGLLHGLAAVHAQRVVHRDIKPENILVEQSGGKAAAKITDFGISRLVTGKSITRLTGLVGTPDYMAPELAHREHAGPAADVYSAGILLYELLCGVTPFAGATPLAVLAAHSDLIPGRPSGVPDRLWSVLMDMLRKDPDQRPNAGVCAERLTALLPELTGVGALERLTEPPTAKAIPKPWWTRQRIGLIVASCLASAGLVAGLLVALGPSAKPSVTSQQFGALVVANAKGQPLFSVSHLWQISDRTLQASTTITNTSNRPENITYDEVVPKELVQSAAQLKAVTPNGETVVQPDPVLEFRFAAVPAGGVRIISYQALVNVKGAPAAFLASLVMAQGVAQNEWDQIHHPGPIILVLASIAPSSPASTTTVGGHLQLHLLGRLTSGAQAPAGVLRSALWSSSDPAIARVDSSGIVTGRAAGRVTVTAEVNDLKASFVVTVLAPRHPTTGSTSASGSTTTATPATTLPFFPTVTTRYVGPTTPTTIRRTRETTTTVHTKPPPATTTTLAAPGPITVSDMGTTGGSGSISATGTPNGNYQQAQACAASSNGGPFSSGSYPPENCAQVGRAYASPTDLFWFSGNQNCANAGKPVSGSTFTWTVSIPRTGHWGIRIFDPEWTNYNLGAVYDWSFAGGSSNTPVNQQAYHGQWVGLTGSVEMDAGAQYQVVLTTADTADGYCHYQAADKVQWYWAGP